MPHTAPLPLERNIRECFLDANAVTNDGGYYLVTVQPRGTSPHASRNAGLSWLAAVVALTFLMLWPAWYNGQPLIFPDSVGYERAGAATLAATHMVPEPGPPAHSGHVMIDRGNDGVSTARSPFYGVPLTLALDAGGTWAVAALQSAVIAAALMMAMRRLHVPLPIAAAAVAVLALASGLAVYAEALMPDVFLGLMVLGFAMLLAVPMPRVERWAWLFAVVAAMLFHKAFLAVGICLTIGAAIGARRFLLDRAMIMLLAGCCLAALAGHKLVEVSVQRVTGQPPLSVPFLLARYGASPVLGLYLGDTCSPPRFVICRYRDRLPLAPDEFLWGEHSLYTGVPKADRETIAAQANTVLLGAVTARPVAAVVEAVRGAVVQLFTVGMSDFAIGIPASTRIDARMAPAMTVYPASAIARRTFPVRPLGLLSLGLYLTGAIAIAATVRRTMRSVAPTSSSPPLGQAGVARPVVLIGVLVTGVVVNAVVSGVLSGVFERYQGRIAWLLPFGAVVLWQSQRRAATARALA